MVRSILRALAFGFALVTAALPAGATTQDEQARADRLRHGVDLLLHQGQLEASIREVFDPLIEEYTRQYTGLDQRIYCPRSEAEGQQYLGDALGDAGHRGVMLTDNPTWAYAYYYKGYALIDLHRMGEARHALGQALELAPRNAQFLAELAATYQNEDGEQMLAISRQAAEATRFSPPDLRQDELGRALRGQGYALIELKRWDEAEQAYKQALQLDPSDLHARSELDYVLSHRNTSP
jgi:tetratricopeptide (TPR) repeat protein